MGLDRTDVRWTRGVTVARLAALVGDSDLAETSFGSALEFAERFDSPLYRARTLLYWGSALLAKGKADRGPGCGENSGVWRDSAGRLAFPS